MNFSFYKNLSKKHLFLFLFFLSLAIGFSRCVPIEDLVPPTVGDFILNEQYNISDTIRFQAILADNFGVSTYRIDIEPIDSTNTSLWRYSQTDSVKARLLDLEKTIIIPSNIAFVGDYKLILTAFDASGKSNITTKNFSVGGDVSDPNFEFPDVILPNINGVGQSPACQLQTLVVKGKATDNIGLKEIRAQLIGQDSDTIYLAIRETFAAPNEPDSVDLQSFFGNRLTIPFDVPNGNLILKLVAIDIENNERSVSDTILVNCDTNSPEIQSIITNLPLLNNNITVIQGQELLITGGIITDNQQLDSVFIYLDDDTNTPTVTTTLITRKIDGTSFDLANLGNIPTPLPLIPIVGEDSYKIRVEVTDTTSNRAIKLFTIKIEDNTDPTIGVTLAIGSIGGPLIGLSSNDNRPQGIEAGTTLYMQEKIQEDVGLRKYIVSWGINGQEETIIDLDETALALFTIPLNVKDITPNTITVSQNVPVGTRYVLNIFTEDTFGQTDQRTYYFQVE